MKIIICRMRCTLNMFLSLIFYYIIINQMKKEWSWYSIRAYRIWAGYWQHNGYSHLHDEQLTKLILPSCSLNNWQHLKNNSYQNTFKKGLFIWAHWNRSISPWIWQGTTIYAPFLMVSYLWSRRFQFYLIALWKKINVYNSPVHKWMG